MSARSCAAESVIIQLPRAAYFQPVRMASRAISVSTVCERLAVVSGCKKKPSRCAHTSQEVLCCRVQLTGRKESVSCKACASHHIQLSYRTQHRLFPRLSLEALATPAVPRLQVTLRFPHCCHCSRLLRLGHPLLDGALLALQRLRRLQLLVLVVLQGAESAHAVSWWQLHCRLIHTGDAIPACML